MPTLNCPWCECATTVPEGAPARACPKCQRPWREPNPANARKNPGRLIAVIVGVCLAVVFAGGLTLAAAGVVVYRNLHTPPALAAAVKQAPIPEQQADEPKKADAPPVAENPPDRAVAALVTDREERTTAQQAEAPAAKQAIAPPDPKMAKALADALVLKLNTYRKTAGLGLVQVDPASSKGCAAHARYVALNPPTSSADTARLVDEEAGKPGFSEDGRRAAVSALVSVGNPRIAVDQWLARVATRVPLLRPELRAVGIGMEPLPNGAWAAVLDVLRGGDDPVVLYPAPRQQDVGLTFTGGQELPEPGATAGMPVTATFPPQRKVTQVQADLHDDAGRPVDAWLSTPEKPARPKGQRNSIALIPKAPLRGNAVYRVHMAASVDGAPWSQAWTFTTEDDADSKGLWAQRAVERVNGFRKQAGLPPVLLDEALSRGCRAHARYLALNLGHPATAGLGAHDEDLALPGASAAGRQAGKASDIAIGDHEPLHGLDAWMATLYHRVPILEPNLKTVGFGCHRSRRQGWVTVLNVGSGRERTPRQRAVFYPVPDQAGVPLHFPIGGEEPNPIPEDTTGRAGFPVTAFFPENAPLRSASAILTDGANREVAAWLSTPEQPANPKYARNQGNTVCLIPKAPLQPSTTYRVLLRGQQLGKGWEKSWQFTTAGAGPTPAEAGRLALARLNRYRAAAGLAALTLDPALSKGCQAHAEFLVRNAAVMAKKKLPANDEDAALPGYTSIGKLAARQSDVFSNAPAPITQIEDLMGTFMRRVYVLDPNLHRVGFGCAHDVGRGWRCVLDLIGGRGSDRIVVFPVPDQEAVARTGTDALPGRDDVPGFPVTATFPASAKIFGARGTLTDPAGKAVETLMFTPERGLGPGMPPSTVALYPVAPLRAGQVYHVTLTVVVGSMEWRQSWQFTAE